MAPTSRRMRESPRAPAGPDLDDPEREFADDVPAALGRTMRVLPLLLLRRGELADPDTVVLVAFLSTAFHHTLPSQARCTAYHATSVGWTPVLSSPIVRMGQRDWED